MDVNVTVRCCPIVAFPRECNPGAKSGAVTVVQRTSSDLRLNPHLHQIVLDGAWHEDGGELTWEALSHLRTSEVGEVLERVVRRMERHLRRSDLLRLDEHDDDSVKPRVLAYDMPGVHRWMGSPSTRTRARVPRTPRGGRPCCATCCVLPSPRSGWSPVRMAWCASS